MRRHVAVAGTTAIGRDGTLVDDYAGLANYHPAAALYTRSLLDILSPCARPVPAALIHMATLWVWHSPMLFDAAVASDRLHWLEHVMFFGTALLFWRAINNRREVQPFAITMGLFLLSFLGLATLFLSRLQLAG